MLPRASSTVAPGHPRPTRNAGFVALPGIIALLLFERGQVADSTFETRARNPGRPRHKAPVAVAGGAAAGTAVPGRAAATDLALQGPDGPISDQGVDVPLGRTSLAAPLESVFACR